MAEGDYEAVRTPLVMSCLIQDRPKAMSQNAHMTLLSLKIRNLIGALFLPLVFAANTVLAMLAWIIVRAVMRQRPAVFGAQ
jgi:hypothetical protein